MKFHEDTHVLNGDAFTGGSVFAKEQRADAGAGYLMVKAGYGAREIEAYIKEATLTTDTDHGTPQQRAAAVAAGVQAALAEGG